MLSASTDYLMRATLQAQGHGMVLPDVYPWPSLRSLEDDC